MLVDAQIFMWVGLGLALCIGALLILVFKETCKVVLAPFQICFSLFYICAPRTHEDGKEGCCYTVCCNDEEYHYV